MDCDRLACVSGSCASDGGASATSTPQPGLTASPRDVTEHNTAGTRPPTAIPVSAAPEFSTETAEQDGAHAAIQALLDAFASAVDSDDQAQISALVDQADRHVLRILHDLASGYQVQGLEKQTIAFELLSTIPRANGLVEIEVLRMWDGRKHTWTVRERDGQWQFSQPTEEELGPEKVTEQGDLRIRYRVWDEELVRRLLPELSAGMSYVHQYLGVTSTAPMNVILKPDITASSDVLKGLYVPGSTEARDRITLVTAGLRFGSYYPWTTFEDSIATVFRHEYTHRINNRSADLVPLQDMPSWMAEGLAEHVAGDNYLNVPQFRELASRGELLSICALDDPPDEIHIGILYGTAQQATDYIIETLGGIERFWALARDYRSAKGTGAAPMEQALQSTFMLSCDEFDHSWHAWVQGRARTWQTPRIQ